MSLPLAVKAAACHVRNLRTRLPFRYGAVTLTRFPLLHLALDVEAADGRRARGFAADNLPPKWFDKDPARTFRDNVEDLLRAIAGAERAYLDTGRTPRPVFDLWRDAYGECARRAPELRVNGLTAAFGSSLFERALADAAGRLAGLDVIALLREDVLGLRPDAVHPGLTRAHLLAWAGRPPADRIAVRHTVGLLDPIVAADVPADGWLGDGLPQTLEECVAAHGLRHFKLKVGGRVDADVERLRRIAAVLDRIGEPYLVTLDGNEQYKAMADFAALVEAVRAEPALARLWRSTAFIEQPLDRAIALDASAAAGLERLGHAVPIIIDESDGDLQAFPRAIALGYRGVSTKNCKGIVKSFLNRTLIERENAQRPAGARLFMSAEDLTNVPVVPLQQDLATVRALGIAHVERNGHHYVRGLAHCSARERAAALRHHGDLYAGDEREAWLRIERGSVRVGSLAGPGYGVGFDPDLDAMVPLERWTFDSLDAGDAGAA
ncbi:MAG TPA: enolase C-terminal domain-like protein [Methylomirabilota bacterium]|nr:enolase C-terminal domain-like protein [Methylomirabilota bacterium]